jgi:uncharacterized protein
VLAVDTNVLVYAHRKDSAFHGTAAKVVADLAQSAATWAIAWPCIHEFYSVVTHPRIYTPPSEPRQAIAQIDAWLSSPSLIMLAESDSHWRTLSAALAAGEVRGALVHDARVAAICADHGVREIISQDRDFSRFPGLRVRYLLGEDVSDR